MSFPSGRQVELILVDNASTDGTAALVMSAKLPNMNVLAVAENRQGKSHALNTALTHASGDILIFTDDDVMVPDDWVEQMAAAVAESGDAVVGRVVLGQELQRPWLSLHHKWLLAVPDSQPEDSPILIGANMAIRRSVFHSVPSFDPELGPGALGIGEEFLFGSQMLEAGRKVKLASNALVTHFPDASRLTRRNWIKMAAACGRTGACI